MKLNEKEVHLKGSALCRGIAIGKPFFFKLIEDILPEFTLSKHEIEQEVLRYSCAVNLCRKDIENLQAKLEKEGIVEGASILEAHLQIIQDPLITTEIEEEIRKTRKNSEHVFQTAIKKYEQKFNTFADPIFRERFKDIQDLSRRILGYLRNSVRIILTEVPPGSIVFAHELTTSDVAEAKPETIAAFITETGGETSHAAIVAKAKGIPFVSNIKIDSLDPQMIERVIVDGRTGQIILNPSPQSQEYYYNLSTQLSTHLKGLQKVANFAPETIDGYQVMLSANIDHPEDISIAKKYGASGVGLLRTEYALLAHEGLPDEDAQFALYRQVVDNMPNKTVVIRTFDVGGDKMLINFSQENETQTFLGCRAIRFLLKERDIFKTQLKAILRTSAYGRVKILLPMISALAELEEAKQILREVMEELHREGQYVPPSVPLGCMIEVPSAAIIADLLAQQCDFLSIGTNDLVQYAMAVDRGNQHVNNIYAQTDPSVIRLIKLIATEANHYGVPVTVCGEMAADPRFTPLLLGLGIQELSVSPRHIPVIKHAIRNTSIVSASLLADTVLSLSTAQEIMELLVNEYQKNVPEDCFYNH
ncbi:phosphoenolpyruvate--protein phosphotransferase [Parachlamydia sp. AcF125]|uniref:phosphoenolpyruvate--protein phosphotransferase n=1 Tax=Parachlamydia sp. AcF125 TaxID=2795736 RepID=UPI001BC93E33|nr:phosphoenolpyruvate--protein phosphotransferase [Parachlamydia sp. AcF125]MBS4167526.1 Phosphoenolpyruvate-protein phosphotransferase [Parachlamydia sp. AcF125]